MKNLNKKNLSILSLLIIPGILLMPLSHGLLTIIPASMCLIGGISFGMLIPKK